MKTYKKMTFFFIFIIIISVLMRPIMLYETAAKEVAYFDEGVFNISKLDFDKGLYVLKGNVAVTSNQLIDPTKDYSDSANVVIHVASHSSHLIGLWQKTVFGPMELVQANSSAL